MRHVSARGSQDHSDRAWVRCRLVVPQLDSGGARLVPDVPDRGKSGRSGPGTRMLVAMTPDIAAPHSARPPPEKPLDPLPPELDAWLAIQLLVFVANR